MSAIRNAILWKFEGNNCLSAAMSKHQNIACFQSRFSTDLGFCEKLITVDVTIGGSNGQREALDWTEYSEFDPRAYVTVGGLHSFTWWQFNNYRNAYYTELTDAIMRKVRDYCLYIQIPIVFCVDIIPSAYPSLAMIIAPHSRNWALFQSFLRHLLAFIPPQHGVSPAFPLAAVVSQSPYERCRGSKFSPQR